MFTDMKNPSKKKIALKNNLHGIIQSLKTIHSKFSNKPLKI